MLSLSIKKIYLDLDGVMVNFIEGLSKLGYTKDELNNEIAHYLVGSINNKVVAYIGAWFILDEAHITNVAVKSDFRRQKIAKQLITAFIVLAKKHQITSITLEVRASNIPAQSLYQQFGFEKQGLRKRYYADNNEDAIIMWLRNI